MIVYFIDRQQISRRHNLPSDFPITDAQGNMVVKDRRQLSDRREEQFDLADLNEKLDYLKTAVYEKPSEQALNAHDSIVLSRVLNEITMDELALLLHRHGNKDIYHAGKPAKFYKLDRLSPNSELTMGLMNLGLLSRCSAEGARSGEQSSYRFTSLADKLVKLLTNSGYGHSNLADRGQACELTPAGNIPISVHN
jgi:hypothetical protein